MIEKLSPSGSTAVVKHIISKNSQLQEMFRLPIGDERRLQLENVMLALYIPPL